MERSINVHSRTRLEAELGHSITDRDWLWLVNERYVGEWQDPEYHDAVLRQITDKLGAVGSSETPVRVVSIDLAMRAVAESELFADVATTDPDVLSFRDVYLGSPTGLGSVEAVAFLRSQKASDVPAMVVRHLEAVAHVKHLAKSPPLEVAYLAKGGLLTLRARPDSVLGELHRLSQRLAQQYPWEPAAAAAFVVEGAVPRVHPLLASTRFSMGDPAPPLARITLDVEPWVPASAVAAFYKELKARMHRPRGRPVSERSAELIWFVLSQRRATPNVTWRELLERWSREHPEHTDRDSRHFYQSYERARRSLLYPGYHPYSRKD
jgi:hypothetical protein